MLKIRIPLCCPGWRQDRGLRQFGRIFECTEFDPPHHIKPGMVTDMYNYSTQEVDAGRSEVQDHTQLQEFKSIQGQ